MKNGVFRVKIFHYLESYRSLVINEDIKAHLINSLTFHEIGSTLAQKNASIGASSRCEDCGILHPPPDGVLAPVKLTNRIFNC